MGRYAYLSCSACKEHIFLGKWLRGPTGGIGFWHGHLCRERERDSKLLGRKALRFLARHMDHDLLVASDEGGRADDARVLNESRDVDDDYDALAGETDDGEPRTGFVTCPFCAKDFLQP